MINIKIKTKKDYDWAIGYLLGKILFLYLKLDPNNLERNWKNFQDEMNISLRNYKNEKPDTSNI